jgi:hypothetical protein
MKLALANRRGTRASVLILTIIIFAFGALFLASYFLVTQSEYVSTSRSQAWNTSMTLAEAGVEDAMSLINKNVGIFGAMTNWSTSAVSVDGWTQPTANVYSMTRWLGTNVGGTNLGYYTVYITNNISGTNTGPTILSTGYATWNSPWSAPQSGTLARKVLLRTKLDALVQGNLVSVTNTTFNGNGVTIDSFDSGDPVHSDWQTIWTYHGQNYGFYPANPMATVVDTNNPSETHKRKDNAMVATDGNLLTVQNANVSGYVNTAPGGVSMENNGGYVGDVNWTFSPSGSSPGNATTAIESGHQRDDMNVVFPDVKLPSTTNWITVTEGGNKKTVSTFTNSGYYELVGNGNHGAANNPIYVHGTNIVIWLATGLDFTGNTNSQIYLETNSDVTFYVDGSFNTGGQSGINSAGKYAPAFSVFGLPDCNSITLGGNGAVTAYVYAPEAYLSMGGGGSTTYDSVGAFFVYQINFGGHINFHYDEALLRTGPSRGYIPTTWQEVQ